MANFPITEAISRMVMRRDDEGYMVFDIGIGWPAVVKGTEQIGLDIGYADDKAVQPDV